MCITISYFGREIDNMGQLRKLIGDVHVMTSVGYPVEAYEGKTCLCALDIDGTAKALRGQFLPNETGDPMFYTFKENEV